MVSQATSGQAKSVRGAANKAEILKAATALFLQQGAAGLSVRAIAAKAGVSTIGVYSHFEGKRGLLEALYVDGFSQLGEAVAAANAGHDPEAAIMNIVDQYLVFSETNRAHYSLMFDSGSMAYQPSAAAESAARLAFGKLAETVSRLSRPALSRKESWALAFDLWALVHGFVTLRGHSPFTASDSWRAAVRSAVRVHLRGALASTG
jgi:AcrR family transcriptional regulator